MKIKIIFVCLAFLSSTVAYASAGYDNGTPAGEGELNLDITINPGDVIDYGQSYLVWGYGLTDYLDFHGYYSHEAKGTDQVYYGLMYNFFSSDKLDLSTAVGARDRLKKTDLFFPQILYTIKLPDEYDIVGSYVNVYFTDKKTNRGQSFDIALRVPVPESLTPSYVRDVKIAIGLFKRASYYWNPAKASWNPTYSIDFRF